MKTFQARGSFLWPVAAALCLLPGAGRAFLGGFEEADGYHTPNLLAGYLTVDGFGLMPTLNIAGDATFYNGDPLNGFINWVPPAATPNSSGDGTHGSDVTRYNAGLFGVNNGGPGGLGTDIADDSGAWRALSGGRLNDDAAAPDFNGTAIQGRDHMIAWLYPGAREGQQVLDLLASDVDLAYEYSLDARDLNGTAPAATGAHEVTMSFWFCPTDSDDGFAGNVLGLAMRDDQGRGLIEIGWSGDNELQYRVGAASLWQSTGVLAGTHGWSNAVLVADTFANTVSLSVSAWDDIGSLGAPQDLVSATAVGFDASAVETLRWTAEGGILDAGSGAVAYKNTFDEFEFNVAPVPEPGSAVLLAAGLLLRWRRRRSRGQRAES